MATVYKTFLNNDITSTRTLLHEAIPITGSILSGTYDAGDTQWIGKSETNIKNYAHGMFQSVYDYPYLSSSVNHIFDITMGYAPNSGLSKSLDGSGAGVYLATQQAKKINMYNEMAQVLVGYDVTGSILEFDADGDIVGATAGNKIKECFFVNFSRLLQKDEIKKGSFQLIIGTGSGDNANGYTSWSDVWGTTQLTISDANKENDYRVNSPAGEYAILSATAGYDTLSFDHNPGVGLIFYQAGIAVLTASIFQSASGYAAGNENDVAGGVVPGTPIFLPYQLGTWNLDTTVSGAFTGSVISSSCDMLRHRIYSMQFNNTTELNSTIHFCRANHNDFNYSSNPTYLTDSQIRVKNNTLDAPVSYVTTVGLYSSDNELLAVAKLSEPLKKDPTNEMTIRVRLDY